jgi:aconitate hydratase
VRRDFNSYGARRGNHEVMMRGTFANIRIKNQMVPGVEGGVTKAHADGRQMPIYDAAMKYQARDAAGDLRRQGIRHRLVARLGGQGHALLGVRAVIAESFERIHRSNLVGMGVLPLQFTGC